MNSPYPLALCTSIPWRPPAVATHRAKTSVHLSSNFGTGTCTAQGSKITCTEELTNLGTLPISEAVVEQVAAVEYPGPASDRVQVAAFFSSDPIGTVDFDISKPAPDDDDDGGGGGGGGHGPH